MRNAIKTTLLLIPFLSSCATFNRCKEKFANTVTDSVRVTVPVSVTVPRDSVVTSFVTDTTYLYKEIQQGRAKVIVERTHTITTVQAKCDSVTIIKKVPVKVPGATVYFGVAPWYKTAFRFTLGALFLVLAVMLFRKFFKHTHDDLLPTENKF